MGKTSRSFFDDWGAFWWPKPYVSALVIGGRDEEVSRGNFTSSLLTCCLSTSRNCGRRSSWMASSTRWVQKVWQPAMTTWPGHCSTHSVRGVWKGRGRDRGETARGSHVGNKSNLSATPHDYSVSFP